MRILRLILCLFSVVISGAAWANPYVLKPGDVLRIEVIEDSSLNRNALILPDGMIAFPLVGLIRAAGKTLPQIRKTLTKGLQPNFAEQPSLHVAVASVARLKTDAKRAPVSRSAAVSDKLFDVFGMGELGKPGKLRMPQGTTLLQFLSQAGGTTPYAAIKRVQVRRIGQVETEVITYKINVKRMMNSGSAKSFLLAPGDVVIVPERKLFE